MFDLQGLLQLVPAVIFQRLTEKKGGDLYSIVNKVRRTQCDLPAHVNMNGARDRRCRSTWGERRGGNSPRNNSFLSPTAFMDLCTPLLLLESCGGKVYCLIAPKVDLGTIRADKAAFGCINYIEPGTASRKPGSRVMEGGHLESSNPPSGYCCCLISDHLWKKERSLCSFSTYTWCK
jgi:hypothetical protein